MGLLYGKCLAHKRHSINISWYCCCHYDHCTFQCVQSHEQNSICRQEEQDVGLVVTHAYSTGRKAEVCRECWTDRLAFVLLSLQLQKAKCSQGRGTTCKVTPFSRMGTVFWSPQHHQLKVLPVVGPSFEGSPNPSSRTWEVCCISAQICYHCTIRGQEDPGTESEIAFSLQDLRIQ